MQRGSSRVGVSLAEVAFVGGIALCLVGCVAHFQQPASGAPHADLTFAMTPNAYVSSTLTVSAFDNESCRGTPGSGLVTTLSRKSGAKEQTSTVPLPLGQRLYLQLSTTGSRPSPGDPNQLDISRCTTLSSFVPEAGHTYEALHGLTGCSLALIDAETRAPPPSYKDHHVDRDCVPSHQGP